MKNLFITLFVFLVFILLVQNTYAQNNAYRFDEEILNAKIIDILETRTEIIEWNNTEIEQKKLELNFLDGSKKGQNIILESDYPGLKKGQKVSINYFKDVEGNEIYSVINISRLSPIIILLFIFIFSVIALSGWQGVRALISLFVAFLALIAFLVPGILNGWNPLWSSVLVAMLVLFVAIFFTHGFNRESSVAFAGTFISVIVTSLLAIYATSITSLTGYSDDVAVYLNFNTGGQLNFTALLLGAMIIGIIGVLDDIAVTQSVVVSELFNSNKNLKRKQVFKKAMRVGREHVGALVNTIVFAYIGAAFPLLLLFSVYQYSIDQVVSMEIVATEIVRSIVGSVGLILTVPLVTFLAVWFLKDYEKVGKNIHSHHNH